MNSHLKNIKDFNPGVVDSNFTIEMRIFKVQFNKNGCNHYKSRQRK